MKFTSENFCLVGAGGYGKQLEFMLKQDKIISSASRDKCIDIKDSVKMNSITKSNDSDNAFADTINTGMGP